MPGTSADKLKMNEANKINDNNYHLGYNNIRLVKFSFDY